MRFLLSRRVSHLSVLLLILLCFGAGASSARTSETGSLSGVVKDSLGNLIEGVEVLLVEKTASLSPTAVARSDAEGRFRIANLPRGAYRIAALKDGYLTFVGKIDTQVQQWLQVVLHPMPELDGGFSESLPEDSSWAFRLPRRYVLDSREPETVVVSETGPEEIHQTSFREPLQMQVDQLFSLATAVPDADGSRSDVKGSETYLRLASAIGERGNLDVSGFRQTFDSSHDDGEELAAASRDAAVVSLAFSYDTSPDTQLAVNAFYSERALEYSTGLTELGPPPASISSAKQAHRHWGYDARWSKRLDDVSSLAVQLDYHDTTLRVPEKISSNTLPGATGLPGEMVTRAVGASGVYESTPIVDHAVQIDFSAQVLDATDPVARIGEPALTPAYFALSGLSVGLNAQDTWSVAGPFSLVYGLGYRHAVTTHDASLVVPRLGGAWNLDRLAMRFLVSYHSVADWGAEEARGEVVPFQPADALGYEVQLEVPLPAGMRVTSGLRYSPIQFDFLGYAGGGFEESSRPLYLTDGNAAVKENRFALIQESTGTRIYFEVINGVVEGTLAPITPYDVPLDYLAARALDYDAGRIGVRVLPSGTDLLLVYEKLVQSPTDASSGAKSKQKSLEIRVMQDLLDLHGIGNWRLLMAVRRAALESEGLDGMLQGQQTALLDSMNHQVSAGLSVTF